MGFAKRRRSIITVGRRHKAAFVAAMACVCLAGLGGEVTAQGRGLGAPQKQSVTFTFGLGSSELYERYGRNAAAMEKIDELIRQVAGTPAAHIDSIVVTSYSTTAEQLGRVEIAEQRIDAVKAYLEPVIRRSQLRQPVVVTGNVVARNNVFMPDQVFDMLKKTTVTVYLNGALAADAGRQLRAANSAAEEEQRYISPFGNKEGGNVFGRVEVKKESVMMAETPVETVVPIEPVTPVQPAVVKPAEIARPTGGGEKRPEPVEPAVPATVVPEKRSDDTVIDKDLQRFIDSLTWSAKGTEAQRYAEFEEVAQPVAPVITQEEPCPEDRDPGIDELIRRMLAEESVVETPVEISSPMQVAVIEKEESVGALSGAVETEREPVAVVADSRKVKPVKEPKAKPVKPVKAPHEPMVLIRPLAAVKTNLAYWAAVAANLEVEFYFAQRWSAAVEGVYTNWNMNLYKKHYAVNEISPEVRYWFGRRTGQYRGLYLGVYGHVGQFDYMFKNEETGNTGDYYGAGISFGAYLPFTRHFGMELGLRGGWVHAGDYDRYYYEAPYYMWKSSHTANYIGLTGAKVSLVYRFGLGEKGRK